MSKSINPLSQYNKRTPSDIVRDLEQHASRGDLTDSDIDKANAYLQDLGYKAMCFERYETGKTLYFGFKLFDIV